MFVIRIKIVRKPREPHFHISLSAKSNSDDIKSFAKFSVKHWLNTNR